MKDTVLTFNDYQRSLFRLEINSNNFPGRANNLPAQSAENISEDKKRNIGCWLVKPAPSLRGGARDPELMRNSITIET